MEQSENRKQDSPLRIGIVGAGFSGTALAAALHKHSHHSIEIVLFEKTGSFGTGPAYSTPFPFHLLNVRASDMSALSDDLNHFVEWLHANEGARDFLDPNLHYADQYVPRFLYGHYLQALLSTIQSDVSQKIKLTMVPDEVVDVIPAQNKARLISKNGQEVVVDKVVLALGNEQPSTFSFPISGDVNCIENPWDYTAINAIKKDEPVLIVGMGLSMIDAVLTLNHQHHQGMIYAVSRHGLLPLPHAEIKIPYHLIPENLPNDLRGLTTYLRKASRHHTQKGGDWRAVINALRVKVQDIWAASSIEDKSRFLRHVLPYWNIHRHRVNNKIASLLSQLANHQLNTFSGRVIAIENNVAKIKLRHRLEVAKIKIKWLINCMGPSLNVSYKREPLSQALMNRQLAILDPLKVGFAVSKIGALKDRSGDDSTWLYTLGPPAKAAFWECSAVPEIRKQSFNLAKHLLNL